ncbi:MAG TPA: N-acetyl-gamma-glutamyl-phosphate reductase [Chloroflexota bacterium]|jgi:N-acetyl-gamma-glutamyl-phosphate reductase
MVRAGIVNVTGYAGADAARLLARHPEVSLVAVTGRSAAGQPLGAVFPHLADLDLIVEPELPDVDVAFSALPHHASAEAIPPLLERGQRVIDISADYRLHDVGSYERWYGAHPSPSLLEETPYGLPELHAAAIAAARLVANPGCYPTAAILALAPIVDLIEPSVIVDAKSGVSGAGRSLSLTTHYCEINENCHAYGLSGHRHLPEMEQELRALRAARRTDGDGLEITFVPHLLPMTRGILATCYARLESGWSQGAALEHYRDYYRAAPFVRVVDAPPQTKQTLGTNLCLIYPKVEERTGRLIVVACIDNLVKGAAGQALQNMNLMLDLPETTGLDAPALYP